MVCGCWVIIDGNGQKCWEDVQKLCGCRESLRGTGKMCI
jgi:hypothetical protein